MKSKKNGFWRFCLSFLPGCAEMYMGLMKMGLSLMALFWGIVAVSVILNIGPLLFLDLIVWFYSFFHARNLSHMPDEAFEKVRDDYLFHMDKMDTGNLFQNQSFQKFVAVLLILMGAVLCLRVITSLLFGFVPSGLLYKIDDITRMLPQIAVGAGIIALGCWMIRGKKKELFDEPDSYENFSDPSKAGREEYGQGTWNGNNSGQGTDQMIAEKSREGEENHGGERE